MTVQQMHDWFDLIQDKVDTVYFTDDEKDEFLNRSTQMYVNNIIQQILPPNSVKRTRSLVDSTEQLSKKLSTITKDITVAHSTGAITYTAIEAQTSSTPILTILRVSDNAGNPATYVRHNDINRFEQNTFKQSSGTNLKYSYVDSGIKFLTAPTEANINLTVVVKPAEIELGVTESNLPLETHDEIVAQALTLAGLGSMDENLIRIKQII